METPILLITDTHLSESNIELNLSIFRQTINYCKDLGLNNVFHLGDVFHSRKSQPLSVLKCFQEILDMFSESDILLYVIPGNHDKTDYSSHSSFLDPFRDHPNLQLCDRSTCIRFPGVQIFTCPYYNELEYEKELNTCIALSKIQIELKTKILLTHIGVTGAVMNNGIKVESVGEKVFSYFDSVFVGHYHDEQKFGNIHYIGSAFQQNYGECYEDKGLTLVNKDLTTQKINLDFPKYIKLEVDVDKLSPNSIREVINEKEKTSDNLRVILVGSENKIKSFNKQELLDSGISVTLKPTEIDKKEIDNKVEPFTPITLMTEFTNFCTKNRLQEEEGIVYLKKAIEKCGNQ